MTRAFACLPDDERHAAMRAVQVFDAFTPDNDPYGEHDCAIVRLPEPVMFKFDYYANEQCEEGADDGRRCYRVLTIMLASDY